MGEGMTHEIENDVLSSVCLVLLHRLAAVERDIMPGPPYLEQADVTKLRAYLKEKVGNSCNFNELLEEVPGLTEAYYELKIREY